MKTSLKTILLASGAMLIAGAASAEIVNKDVVKNSFGNVVKNTFQNCVITKWDGATGECGDAAIATEQRTIYFDFNSALLTPAGKSKLDVLANLLQGNAKSIKIVGFADAIGTDSYNNALSMRRANVVKAYLESKGVVIAGGSEVRGLGETSSQSQCAGQRGAALKACLWRDRRVEVEITQ